MIEDIKKACQVMASGGIILYPTDTVWGIGCDATNEEAVAKVYKLKQRVNNKAMIVLLDNEIKLNNYVKAVPEIAWDLVELAETPLTIIYSGANNLASNLVGEDGTVGIRVTREAFSRSLCQRFKKPIVSTSANISGEPTPSRFKEISQEIIKGVDYVVGFRQDDNKPAEASHIVKIDDGGVVKVIR